MLMALMWCDEDGFRCQSAIRNCQRHCSLLLGHKCLRIEELMLPKSECQRTC